jgi:class 3 adenylate cyclase
VDGAAFPALSIAAFLQLGSSAEWSGEILPGSSLSGPEATLTLAGYPGLEIPLDRSGAMRIPFAKAPEAFRAVSAVDVMDSRVDLSILQDSWVIVGGTAFGMADIVPTPYSGAAFGVELQARLLTGILDMSMPFTPLGAPLISGVIILAFAAVLYLLANRADRVAAYGLPAAALLLPMLAASIHISTLSFLNLWLGWLAPALFSLVAASSLLILELGRVRLERARVFGNLNSYLPQDVAREIAFSLPSSNVNARRSNVTLLNADLRNFSAFSEARPPEEIAALLHFFFTRVTEIVEQKGGRVQEFRGDGILAIWGSADGATAQKALQAAEIMQTSLNDRLLPQGAIGGLEPLALGVGIEQGPVLIGSIGPAHRRSYTLLGDTVSITLRIQEMTAELAQPILLGECVGRQLNDTRLQSQGSYLLEGLRIPHTLFAPSPSDTAPTSLPALAESGSSPNLTIVSGGKS